MSAIYQFYNFAFAIMLSAYTKNSC